MIKELCVPAKVSTASLVRALKDVEAPLECLVCIDLLVLLVGYGVASKSPIEQIHVWYL